MWDYRIWSYVHPLATCCTTTSCCCCCCSVLRCELLLLRSVLCCERSVLCCELLLLLLLSELGLHVRVHRANFVNPGAVEWAVEPEAASASAAAVPC